VAKKNTEEQLQEIANTANDEMSKVVKNLLKDMEGSRTMDEVKVTEWVSTGIKSLNFLLSGDIDKGIPAGKMIVVAGDPQSGKSIIGARIAAHAQKQGFIPVWLDSEYASDERFLARAGIDLSKGIYKEIPSAEFFVTYASKLLTKAKEKKLKLFIVLDSLGNLGGLKEISDVDEGKMTADMGQRAKNIRTALRQVLHRLAETNSILYCVNHTYMSPGFVPKKEMGGGLAPAFLAQIVLFLAKLSAEEGISTKVKIKSKKNREFIEGRTTEFLIDFREGIDDTNGMMDLFREFKIVKEKGAWYNIEGDEKSYREKDLMDNPEVFNKLLTSLKEKVKGYNYYTFDK